MALTGRSAVGDGAGLAGGRLAVEGWSRLPGEGLTGEGRRVGAGRKAAGRK
jgi:hypothetical protein